MSTEDSNTSEVKSQGTLKFRAAMRTDVGRRRTENQDSYGFLNTNSARLYVVADGMGGARGGGTASAMAVHIILDGAIEPDGEITLPRLRRSISFANKVIYSRAQQEIQLSGMGTTVVALAIIGEQAIVAHVGDSRIYLCREGKLTQLTRDHTLVQELVDTGAIAPKDAANHPIAHMLTRSLGPTEAIGVDIQVLPEPIRSGDKFMLCSDGLYNHVSNEQILEVMLANTPEKAVAELLQLALDGGGSDNVTVEVIEACHKDEGEFHDELPPRGSPIRKVESELDVSTINGVTLAEYAANSNSAAAVEQEEQALLAETQSSVAASRGEPELGEKSATDDSVDFDRTREKGEPESGKVAEHSVETERTTESAPHAHSSEAKPQSVGEPPESKWRVGTLALLLGGMFFGMFLFLEQNGALHSRPTNGEGGATNSGQQVHSQPEHVTPITSPTSSPVEVPSTPVLGNESQNPTGGDDQTALLHDLEAYQPSASQTPTSPVEVSAVQVTKVGEGLTPPSPTETPATSEVPTLETIPSYEDVSAQFAEQKAIEARELEQQAKDEQEYVTLMKIPAAPRLMLGNDKTSSPTEPIVWENELKFVAKAMSSARPTVAPSPSETPIKFRTVEENRDLADQKDELRAKIADVDAKLGLLVYETKENAHSKQVNFEMEVVRANELITKLTQEMRAARTRYSKWEAIQKSAGQTENVKLADEIAPLSAEVAEKQKIFAVETQKYLAISNALQNDKKNDSEKVDLAARMAEAGRQAKTARMELELAVGRAVSEGMLRSQRVVSHIRYKLAELAKERDVLNRHIGFVKGFIPSTLPRRKEMQKRYLDERAELVKRLTELSGQLSDEQEVSFRLERSDLFASGIGE